MIILMINKLICKQAIYSNEKGSVKKSVLESCSKTERQLQLFIC